MSDDQIRAEWRRITRMWDRDRPLARRVALMECDKLEAAGVTDADVDRLFSIRTASAPQEQS